MNAVPRRTNVLEPLAYAPPEVMQIVNQLFSFSKLLVVVLGPISVEELVSVEDAPPDRFVRDGIKINILTCL